MIVIGKTNFLSSVGRKFFDTNVGFGGMGTAHIGAASSRAYKIIRRRVFK
jgi:hypothetical protein